jgi:hypothetical protein
MMKSIAFKFTQVALTNIDRKDRLTDYSLSPQLLAGGADGPRGAVRSDTSSNSPRPGTLDSLTDSIQEIGVIHPVILGKTTAGYTIICGHRRVRVGQTLGLAEIPARVAQSDLGPEIQLRLNLMENRSHRSYSDIEKGRIIHKLVRAGVSEEIIIRKYMPILGLERSKKLYQEFSRVPSFVTDLQILLHETNVPMRIFSRLLHWSEPCRDTALRLFASLRPGINKWRELLELAEEIARIENKSPGEIFRKEEIQNIIAQNGIEAHEKYDRIVKTLTPWRYPVLHDLRMKVASILDQLSLGPQTKICVHESFETEEIKIEIKGRDHKSLIEEMERLGNATRSNAMGELLRILRELK